MPERLTTHVTEWSVAPQPAPVLIYPWESAVQSAHLVRQCDLDRLSTPASLLLGLRVLLELPDLQVLRVHLDPSLTLDLCWARWQCRVERKDPPQIHSPTCRLKWDLWAPGDLQACEEPQDPKVSWDHRETTEILDQLDLLVRQV